MHWLVKGFTLEIKVGLLAAVGFAILAALMFCRAWYLSSRLWKARLYYSLMWTTLGVASLVAAYTDNFWLYVALSLAGAMAMVAGVVSSTPRSHPPRKEQNGI